MAAPIKKFSVGGIAASIWENASDDRTYNTVSLSRNYKDREGKWKNSASMRVNDLPKAVLALQKAYEYLALKEPEMEKN